LRHWQEIRVNVLQSQIVLEVVSNFSRPKYKT